MSLRFLITFLVLVLGLGTALLIPKNFELREARVQSELPTFVDDWFGELEKISQAELNVLAPDTEFSRRIYTDDGNFPLMASVVLSGHDLNNSIHRPERCMQAQGWTIMKVNGLDVTIPDQDIQTLPVRSLELAQFFETPEDTGRFAAGTVRKRFAITNYFFVGADTITDSHYGRTFTDMFQRLTHGSNQRWAFIMIMAEYGAHVVPPEGFTPEQKQQIDEALAEQKKLVQEKLDDFTKKLVPDILLPPNPAGSASGGMVSSDLGQDAGV